jgi:hypothetical protein
MYYCHCAIIPSLCDNSVSRYTVSRRTPSRVTPLNTVGTVIEEEEEEEDDPRVGGQWRIATLSRRGKRSPAL